MATFDHKPAVVIREGSPFGGLSACLKVHYGGDGSPDGPGCGEVYAAPGGGDCVIFFWRLPESEGGGLVVDRSVTSVFNEEVRWHLRE